MASGRLAETFRFRGCALDRLREDDRVLQRKVSRLLKEPLLDLLVETASDEAVTNEFELDGTVLAVGCQSLELGYEVEDVFACFLRSAVKFCASVDDLLALSEAFTQSSDGVIVGGVRVGNVGCDACCVNTNGAVEYNKFQLFGGSVKA